MNIMKRVHTVVAGLSAISLILLIALIVIVRSHSQSRTVVTVPTITPVPIVTPAPVSTPPVVPMPPTLAPAIIPTPIPNTVAPARAGGAPIKRQTTSQEPTKVIVLFLSSESDYIRAYYRWFGTLANSLNSVNHPGLTRSEIVTLFARVDGVWADYLQQPAPTNFATSHSLMADALMQMRRAKISFQFQDGDSIKTELKDGVDSLAQSARELADAIQRIRTDPARQRVVPINTPEDSFPAPPTLPTN